MKVAAMLKRKSIVLRYTVGGKRYEVYVGLTVEPSRWSQSKGHIKGEGYVIASRNALIKNYQSSIEQYVLELNMNNQSYNHEILKAYLYNKFNSDFKKKSDRDGLVAYFDIFLDLKKDDLTEVTKKAYTNTKNHLLAYLKIRRVADILFEDVNGVFYTDFKDYLKEERSLAPATRGKQFKNIKAVMQEALDKGEHKSIEFKGFKKENEPSVDVYITKEEIRELLLIDDLSQKEQEFLDTFVFLCYTGLRFSDYEMLKKHSFRKEKDEIKNKYVWYIHFIQEKTKSEVRVPIIHKEAISILEKYSFEMPKYSNQYFNSGLKKLLKRKRLFEDWVPVKKEKIKGDFMKRDFISSHTGRRSFCTNLYLRGAPFQFIMAASGHESESALKLYIKADKITKAIGLEEYANY